MITPSAEKRADAEASASSKERSLEDIADRVLAVWENALTPSRAQREFTPAALGELVFLPCALLYMELVLRLHLFGSLFDASFVRLAAGAFCIGLMGSALTMLLRDRGRRVASGVLTAVAAVLFFFQASYHNHFRVLFSWRMLGQAKDVVQFWREALASVGEVWYLLPLLLLPLLLWFFGGKLWWSREDGRRPLLAATGGAMGVLCHLLLLLTLISTQTQTYGAHYYYTYAQNDLDHAARSFGLLTVTRLDVKQTLFGAPMENFSYIDTPLLPTVSPTDEVIVYADNVMDIDFEAAAARTERRGLKAMDEYFASVPPTKQNQYTGMFKGKNLICITMESFCPKVIDPEFTPTLYRMANEGFVFENFYTTHWAGSTASGEYSTLTGNFYPTSDCLYLSSFDYLPFTLAHQLGAQGYRTVGYHNNTFGYYERQRSHPNFGYEFYALGRGLTLQQMVWPRSDKEMAEVTADDYIGKEQPFHAYYMSVSGHSPYVPEENAMAQLHMDELPAKYAACPESVRTYLACQYEMELMLEVLVQKLEEAGQLEDTVFAMVADHYPYALHNDALAALYGLEEENIRDHPDLYRNSFILWSASMEKPVRVEAPATNMDVLPTLLNLFGLTYDSRIMMGRDILAEGDHMALLKLGGWTWISTQGTYLGSRNEFVPSPACLLSGDELTQYVDSMNARVRAMSQYGPQIMDNNYYRHLFPDSEEKQAADY